MNAKTIAALVAALMLVAVPAWADWNPGDGHKMHYPQLPDPQGWDVSFLNGPLGDDWQCTETGPVSDIHMWLSFRNDDIPIAPIGVGGFVEIWSDVPQGPGANFSHPGKFLWGMGIDTNMPNVKMRFYEDGDQRWLEPGVPPDDVVDHHQTFQINIDPIEDPFIQQKDTIYWLVSHLFVEDPTGPANQQIGWKTSMSPQFLDDGVYTNPFGAEPRWLPLEDPFRGVSLDLAFVITIPEPGTMLLLVLGLVGIVAVRRNR